jgi:hypothetical protein
VCIWRTRPDRRRAGDHYVIIAVNTHGNLSSSECNDRSKPWGPGTIERPAANLHGRIGLLMLMPVLTRVFAETMLPQAQFGEYNVLG